MNEPFNSKEMHVPSNNDTFQPFTGISDLVLEEVPTSVLLEGVEYVEPLPPITPEILYLFKRVNEMEQSEPLSRKHKPRKKRFNPDVRSRINGFTAFKAYYSTLIPPMRQQKLSSLFSQVWSRHKYQHVWDSYSAQYRRKKRGVTFIQWLINTPKGYGFIQLNDAVTYDGRGSNEPSSYAHVVKDVADDSEARGSNELNEYISKSPCVSASDEGIASLNEELLIPEDFPLLSNLQYNENMDPLSQLFDFPYSEKNYDETENIGNIFSSQETAKQADYQCLKDPNIHGSEHNQIIANNLTDLEIDPSLLDWEILMAQDVPPGVMTIQQPQALYTGQQNILRLE